jgi:hypothetical protein
LAINAPLMDDADFLQEIFDHLAAIFGAHQVLLLLVIDRQSPPVKPTGCTG